MLDAARRGEDQAITLAVVELIMATGEKRFAFVLMEYGDGEGTRNAREFIEEATPFLRRGERLALTIAHPSVLAPVEFVQ